MTIKWEKQEHTLSGNLILEAKDFYISYICSLGMVRMGDLGSEDGGPETALMDEEGGNCYVLNGDFRKEYEKLVPLGFDECLKFYNKQKGFSRSSWSD